MSTTPNQIKITNTLTKSKEGLGGPEQGEVGIYACGVTTYDHAHIGHAMPAIYFDLIRNYLTYRGYKVRYVRNFTDVDDKIIARAKEQGISPAKLAADMCESYNADMANLGLAAPDHEPRVSTSIEAIIALIQKIIENDHAYATPSGDVYYRVRAKNDYGKLSNRSPDDMRSGAREIVHGDKEDELDFALWKHDETADASWPSPWGQGRPGWHIECSAMAKTYLGDTFAIHGGGRDLIFPHHENEIAQSESANQRPYAKFWMHTGLMTIEKQKMSKSLGNHILIRDFLKEWPAEVLRLAFVSNPYSSNIDFAKGAFQEAFARLIYYYRTLAELQDASSQPPAADPATRKFADGLDPKDLHVEFCEMMNDDFNSCRAIGTANQWFRKANDLLKKKPSQTRSDSAAGIVEMMRELFAIFCMLQVDDYREALNDLKRRFLVKLNLSEDVIIDAIARRKAARSEKRFEESDKIRDELAAQGIELMDTPQGTDWQIRWQPETTC